MNNKQSEASSTASKDKRFTIRKLQQKASPAITQQKQPNENQTISSTNNPPMMSRHSFLKEKAVQEPNNNAFITQLKNAESQIHILQVQNAELISKVKQLEVQLKQPQEVSKQFILIFQIISKQYKNIQELTEEVHHWLKKIADLEKLVQKIKLKKKKYKLEVVSLKQQLVSAQENTVQRQDPFSQLLEMRQMLIQLRMQAQLIPLIQQQVRIRQFQGADVDVDNMTYDQLLQLEDQMGNQEVGLARSDIKRIRKRAVMPINHSDMCTVCQHNMQDGERYRKLSCNHSYHAKCIKGWLLHHRTCPLCKVEVSVPS